MQYHLRNLMLWLACTFALITHANDTGPLLRAVIQSSTDAAQKVGMYEFSADTYGFTLVKQSGELNSAGGAGMIETGAFMVVAVDDWSEWGLGKMCSANAFSTSSFESLLGAATTVEENVISTALALSPTGKGAYGCFEDTHGGYEFGMFNSDSFERSTIATLSTPWLACDFDANGTLYAIDRDGRLSAVNTTTGEMTLVAETGITASTLASGAIDKVTSIFYVSNGEKLYAVQLPTGTVKELYALANNEQLVGMYVQKSGTIAEAAAPAKITDLVAEFEKYALSGKVRFTMPTADINGTTLNGTLGYKVMEGGTELATGTAAPGGNVAADITLAGTGSHTVSVVTTNEDKASEAATIVITVTEKPAAAQGAVLRAVIQSSTDAAQKVGAYEFSADTYGFTLVKQSGELNSAGGAGMIEAGAFMSVAVDDYSEWGLGKFCTAYVFHANSFETLISGGMSVGENTISTALALSPTGKGAYGCFEDTHGGYEFGMFNSDSFERSTIATLSTPWLACDFDANGTLYAIDRDGRLSAVNTTTGAMTLIAETGITASTLASGAIDKVTSIFYVSNGEKLYAVQLPIGTVKELYALANNEQLVGMFVQKNGTVSETSIPNKVTGLVAEFEEYALSGKVNFTMPATDNKGTALEGTLGYKVAEGSNVLATGTAAPGEAVSADVTFTETGRHEVSVVATSGYAQSEEAILTIDIAAKYEGIVPPYVQPFDTQDNFNTLSTFDGNGDGWGWMWWQQKAYCQPCFTEASDDYLITPALWLEAGKMYTISFTAWQRDITNPEKLEVVVGDKAEAASLQPIGNYEFTDGKAHDLEYVYTAERTGVHYVGLHLVSDKNMYGIYMDDLKVGKGIMKTAPAAQPFTAAADVEGALSANITVTPNAKTIEGNDTELTKISILRNDVEVKTFTEGFAAALSFTDIVEERGLYTYSVVAENADGEGVVSKTKVYVGINKAGPVQSATAVETENTGEVTVSWVAPATDIDGNPINPDFVSYMIMYKPQGGGQTVVGRGLKGSSYTFRVKEAEEAQEFMRFLVFTETEAGVNDLQNVATEAIPVGKADEMPYHLGFGGTNEPVYFTTSERTTATWTVSSDVDDHDGDGAYLFNETYDGIGGAVYTGKINVAKENSVFSFWYMCMADGEEVISIEANDGTGFKPVSSVNISEGKDMTWSKHSVSLAEYTGKNVQIRISYVSKGYRLAIDDLNLTEASSLDLSPIGIGVPVSVKAGVGFKVRVEVANLGAMPSGAFDVELYRDDELIETQSADNLDGVSSATFDFTQSISSLVNSYAYKAKVVCENDKNQANNESSTITVDREATTLPVPTEATATVDTGSKKVEIAWQAPQFDFTPVPTTDGAEDYRAFSTGLPTSQLSSYDNIGEWKTIDADGLKTIVIQQGNAYLQYPNANTPFGFIVFKPSEAGIPEQYMYKFKPRNPENNTQYFAAVTSSIVPNDDWLVSPLLSGNAQEISFYAKSCVSQYPESFEVYYSTGGTEVADFVKVGGESGISDQWTEYKYNLPEGARHFAVRYMANDKYVFMVDDFTFEKAPRDEKITLNGYNVYRENELISSIEKDAQLAYTDIENDNPENSTYSLTAVYAEGESEAVQAKAVTTSINGAQAGGMRVSVYGRRIIVDNPAAEPVTICDTAGRNIVTASRNTAIGINVTPGVYIVKGETVTTKVMVK